MKVGADTAGVAVGFEGRAARIARVRQLEERARIAEAGPEDDGKLRALFILPPDMAHGMFAFQATEISKRLPRAASAAAIVSISVACESDRIRFISCARVSMRRASSEGSTP